MKPLPIGYGNGGETPFMPQYPLTQANVTILKFYFMTSPMDLKWLEQGSPFVDPGEERGFFTSEETWKELNATSSLVFTSCFTIVQRSAHP